MTAPSVSLLPCPFCGIKPIAGVVPTETNQRWEIRCDNIDCFGPVTTAFSLEDNAAQWNTRATTPAPTPSAARKRIALTDAQWLKKRTATTGRRLNHWERAQFLDLMHFAEQSILALPPDAAAIRAAAFEEAAKILQGRADGLNERAATSHTREVRAACLSKALALIDAATAIRAAGRRG